MLRNKSGICIKLSVLYNKKTNINRCKRTRLETYGLLGLVFNSTFNTFQWGQFYWWSKMESTRENHEPATSHWQTLSHNVVSAELDSNS